MNQNAPPCAGNVPPSDFGEGDQRKLRAASSTRPRGSQQGDCFPSLGAAAGAIGVDRDWLIADKRAGAGGFDRSGRLRLRAYAQWLLEQRHRPGPARAADAAPVRPATLNDAKMELAIAQAEAQRVRTAERYGQLISRDRHNEMVRQRLEAGLRFIAELPARFAATVNPGAPEVGAGALAEVVEQIKARFRGEGQA